MDIKKNVLKAFSLAPRSAPVAKLPEQAEAGGLTEPEITHLELALYSWSAGSSEKKSLADQLVKQAKSGDLKGTIVWAHDLPDMIGSRFVVARAGAFKSDSHAEVERLQAECAKRKGKLPPSEELKLINQCMDLYEATSDARSPLEMKKMVELGARACRLTMKIYKSHNRLVADISKDTCHVYANAGFSELGYVKFQIALKRLLRVTEGAGMRLHVACQVFIKYDYELKKYESELKDYGELTDSDVRELFANDQFFRLSHGADDAHDVIWAAGDADRLSFHKRNLLPRWVKLTEQDDAQRKMAVRAAFAVPAAVLDFAAGWISGPPVLPSATELQTYALKMAELLEPKNTNGQPTHIVVQRALTAIKAYNDYFAASSSDPTLELDWTKLKACVETVGAWRAQLGGGAFPDADAEQAYQRLLKAEPPVEKHPQPPTKTA